MKFNQIFRQAVLMAVLPLASTLQAGPNENNNSIPIQDEVIKIVTAADDGATTNDKNSEVTLKGANTGKRDVIIITSDCLCFTAEEGHSRISLRKYGNPDIIRLQYSSDNRQWQDYELSEPIFLDKAGDKVYIQAKYNESGSGTFSKNETNYYQFSIHGRTAASGNIMSLIDPTHSRGKLSEYVFYALFRDQDLTTAPMLPAEELTKACYKSMFEGCRYLTEIPKLPAIKLAESCYENMFSRCTSLRLLPILGNTLPAMEMKQYCYKNMFSGCTSLIRSTELPATKLAWGCYDNMFSNCSSLTNIHYLPATKMATLCYHEMYANCISLTYTAGLPATELAERCYEGMFYGCTSLIHAAHLPATQLVFDCYRSMFQGCSSLKNVTANFTDWAKGKRATYSWLDGTAENGIFDCPKELEDIRGLNYIPTSWVVNPNYFCFTAEEDETIIETDYNGVPDDVLLEYSYDRKTWETFEPGYGDEIYLEHAGDKAWVRAESTNSTFNQSANDYYYFIINNRVSASGNIMSLLDATCQLTKVPDYAFYGLFENCKSLTKAPQLPATELGSHSYEHMFDGCESLITAPELPATKLNSFCYSYMFSRCENIVKAPALPATGLSSHCYQHMFDGCESLTRAPKLPATKLNSFCYSYMFSRCENLINAPALPATMLSEDCYKGMFAGCSSLTNAPTLPATMLSEDCYKGMFAGCSSLTQAPGLPATELVNGCYERMFEKCTSLKVVAVNFSEWPTKMVTKDWLNDVAPKGKFICHSRLKELRDASFIPSGWTIVPLINKKDSDDIFDRIHKDDNNRFDDIITNVETHTITGETTKDKQGLVVKDGKVVLIKK